MRPTLAVFDERVTYLQSGCLEGADILSLIDISGQIPRTQRMTKAKNGYKTVDLTSFILLLNCPPIVTRFVSPADLREPET